MGESFDDRVSRFIFGHRLPVSYREIIDNYCLPLAENLAGRVGLTPLLVGINGAQGTGKSTIADILALILHDLHGLRTAVISIDDFYLSRAEREQLAASVHPLLKTRGVPGTHNIQQAIEMIGQLKTVGKYKTLSMPTFDKAEDDVMPPEQWREQPSAVDVILLEGWCVGTPAQDDQALLEPVNALEACEDADSSWRRFVNENLSGSYHELNAMIDFLLLLEAPDFETVFEWRGKQEDKLRDRNPDAGYVMSGTELIRFIQHYERLTRHNLKVLPELADAVLSFDHEHRVQNYRYKDLPSP